MGHTSVPELSMASHVSRQTLPGSCAVACRDLVLEERDEKRVTEIIQKTLEQRGSFDRKFFYAVNRYVAE